jgi:hypothetical protein
MPPCMSVREKGKMREIK